MRRRDVLALLGSAAAAMSGAARAQQPSRVIGFLNAGAANPYAPMVAGFRRGLNETGYAEGQNLATEYRWAEGQYDKLSSLAADLVRQEVAVIAATTVPAVTAAKAATMTIPIVFAAGGDPVQLGLVASLNRPGGNVTGVTTLNAELGPKRLELVRELVKATSIAALVNSTATMTKTLARELRDAAAALGLPVVAHLRAGALLIVTDPFFVSRSEQLAALALRHALPTIHFTREFAVDGGLMSYGTSLPDAYRLAGIYVGRILNGEKPADLPVQQSTKLELVINLKTAKALGLTVPQSLLARADEVIE